MDNLSAVDLNLLVALDALLSENSVTRAAQRLGLSQPAMSNALARLRDLLDDPLLVRTGRGMTPTSRALELAAPVQRLVLDIRRTLAPPPSFDAKTSTLRFRIESADDIELSLIPRLVPRLVAEAPHTDLTIMRASTDTEDALRTGRSDVYLGAWAKVPSRLHAHLLRQEGFACIARRDHPRIKSRLTLRAYADVGHVVITHDERPGNFVDTALADQGLGRQVAVRTPNILVGARIVAQSDLIATLPRKVAETLAKFLPLDVFKPPLDTLAVSMYMVWHPRTHEQPPYRWLRGRIMDASAESEW